MIFEIINPKSVRAKVSVNNWEEAIRYAGGLLFDNGSIESSYIDRMVNIVKEIGPYIVMIEGVAFAHARPEDGANRIDLSVITLKEPINFGQEENDPVVVVFALSAVDNVSHIELLKELGIIFENMDNVAKLAQCESDEALLLALFNIINGKQ